MLPSVVRGFGPAFRALRSLRHLSLLLNAHIAAELDALAQPTLETLIIRPAKLRDLTPLARCTRLRHLELPNSQVDDLSPVSSSLELLNLSGTNSQIDLRQLVRFERLQTLDLRRVAITDWSPIAELPALKELIVTSAVARELPPALQAKCRMNDGVF